MSNYEKNFELAHKIIAEAEGGLAEHKNDPGGITKFGISLRFLEDYEKTKHGRKVLNSLGIGAVNRAAIVGMTKAQSTEIMYQAFWLSPRINELPKIIAIITYDFAVNSGSFYAAKVLQKALEITVDGIIGVDTIATAHAANKNNVAKKMLEERARFYIRLAKQKPKFEVFLKGWLNRVENLKEYINKVNSS